MYLDASQIAQLKNLLEVFFSLPYSKDLEGKDAELLLRIVKNAQGALSRKKELFDIKDGDTGYSVKTLGKPLASPRVDLQEQRFGDVKELQDEIAKGRNNVDAQGELLLSYMKRRIKTAMKKDGIKVANSLILLKHWNKDRTKFTFRYWEEDFEAYIDNLVDRNNKGEIEWVRLKAGLHGRDKHRQDKNKKNVRLLRMHDKHNQIFTDHDIPTGVIIFDFVASPITLEQLIKLLAQQKVEESVDETVGLLQTGKE